MFRPKLLEPLAQLLLLVNHTAQTYLRPALPRL
jgi:hypothetical protein